MLYLEMTDITYFDTLECILRKSTFTISKDFKGYLIKQILCVCVCLNWSWKFE